MDNPGLDPYESIDGHTRQNSGDYQTTNLTPNEYVDLEDNSEKVCQIVYPVRMSQYYIIIAWYRVQYQFILHRDDLYCTRRSRVQYQSSRCNIN